MFMKIDMKYLLASFLIVVSGMTHAQNTSLLDSMYADFASGCVTLDFSYSIKTGASDILGKGTVAFQDNAYHMTGNGIEICCDGKDVWLMDPKAKEVYIEAVGEGTDAFLQNPALLFTGLKDNFSVSGVKDGHIFELVPKVDCGIDECTVRMNKDGNLSSGEFIMSEGQIVSVDVSAIKKSDRKDISSFRPTRSFDSSWMVTDLR